MIKSMTSKMQINQIILHLKFNPMLLSINKDKTSGKLDNFHSWFSSAVGRWLHISQHTALIRIGRAVALDSFNTVDSLVRYSSSAVDTITVFYQIKTFWQQLNWPDPRERFAFVIKIIDLIFFLNN